MRYCEKMCCKLHRQLGPTVNFFMRDHKQMPVRCWLNIHKRHAFLIFPDKTARNLAVNNLGKNTAHSILQNLELDRVTGV